MATDVATPREYTEIPSRTTSPTHGDTSALEFVRTLLSPLASLRVTIVLFLLAIFLVFAGTLAQVDLDILDVLHKYFRAWYVWIPCQVFFPRSFFPTLQNVPGMFLFPGGATIGVAMIINLLAAHAVRFKVQAKGTRLLAGLAVLGLGVVSLFVAIASGFSSDGILEASLIPWPILWRVFVSSLVLVSVTMAYAWFQFDASRRWERILLGVATLVLGALTAWLVWRGDTARLNDSGMRILWQLLKGQAVATVLFVGCHLLFKKRAGIVLLHSGVGLMMISEVVVSFWAVEGQVTMREGETLNYVSDIRTVELAVIDRSNPDRDTVVSIPKSFIMDTDRRIEDPRLPFDIQVVEFMENSNLKQPTAKDKNLATAGLGKDLVARAARPLSGTDIGKGINYPSAYVRLFDKKTKQELGTHLISLFFSVNKATEKAAVGDKSYDLELRHLRTYKPYSLTLLDVRKDDYVGTSTPKNYSSDVHLVDGSRGVDRPKVHIKMNEPLRFADETFYQSSYYLDQRDGAEYTTLSVVSNFGWMIPYISCMIVFTGMFAQFMSTLGRFLDRMDRGTAGPAFLESMQQAAKRAGDAARVRRGRLNAEQAESWIGKRERWFATGAVLLAAMFVSYYAMKPLKPHAGMDLDAFGKLPVAHQGRVKPLDTVARNTLRILSGKIEFRDVNDKKQPAIRWLADLLARPDEAMAYKVFRIDHLDLLATLGLERRKLHYYAITEFQDKLPVLEEQAEEARKTPPDKMSAYQRKVLELEKKLGEVITLRQAFSATVIRPDHAQEDVMSAMQRAEFLERGTPPLAIPPTDDATGKWTAYSTATFDLWRREIMRAHGDDEAAKAPLANVKIHPAVDQWSQIFTAYAQGDAKAFNRDVAAYRNELGAAPPQEYGARRIRAESAFNRAEPFFYTAIVYFFCFLFSLIGMFGALPSLRSLHVFQTSATWLLAFSLLVHTVAIIARVYISQYAPVTNLYSSAVFIGWACVALALVLESIFRIGLANMVGSAAGFLTLLVAHYLSLDGDTIGVMQAVLDTQFWLSTHVVTVALGYSMTLNAGLLGVAYIIYGVFTPRLDRGLSKTLAGMIYSVICFAMFFSFIGTVLGGLWADDSWGRFWGWDPKENGALIIVLWNALVLHARWGKMVGDRGLAILAILGNICTCWSWFGVNELGVGLHSYGFTEGVLKWLGIAAISHLIVAGIGLMPQYLWLSGRALLNEEPAPTAAA